MSNRAQGTKKRHEYIDIVPVTLYDKNEFHQSFIIYYCMKNGSILARICRNKK